MLYGVSYYHEYQPFERLAEDVRLMAAAGLTVARVGESTWASWEPTDSQFAFAWMDRVVDALHAAGIRVILGTPTYAIPPWLARQHPEIMAAPATGRQTPYGARQNMNHAHPVYRAYAARIIRQVVARYAPHPAIIGYQVDNETSSGPLHNPDVFQQFVAYLQRKFGSVETLNRVWGLAYWSQLLGDWDDLWPPDGNTSPGYDLEWRRFQSALVTDLLHWQAALVRELARPDQFVTQDFVAVHGRPESDVFAIMRALDVMAINPYHLTQDGLDLRPTTPRLYGAPEWMGSAATEPGVWRLYLNADFARGVKERSFLVTELNALSIGGAHANYPAYDGQWRLVAYALIARGATLIAYWHWHTLHYSNETYWGGVLGHDLQPGRAYAEVQRIAAELRRHDALLTDLRPDAGVAFLYSQDSKYALEFQPALARPGTNDPDPRTYGRVFDTFYQSFFEARAQAVVLHPEQTFAAYPVLVVPALYIADEALLARLVEYAQAGGHLLLTFRSGYADALGRIRWTRAPGPLRAAVGASYQEYSNLVTPLPLTAAAAGFDLPAGARALAWADGLLLEGATPLAMYDHPHFGRFPAVVSQALGCGRVTYCGTLPNAALGTALARWVLDQAGVRPPFTDLPAPVRVTSATAADGRRLLFVSNWSAVPQRIAHLALAGTELFTGAARVAGDALPLEPWDTRIIIAS